MPNPFGITEVSLPAIYGAVNDNRMSRIQQMLGQRQLEALERQADRELQSDSIIARITGQGQSKPMGGAYSGDSAQGGQIGSQIANGITGALGVPPAAAPSAPSSAQPGAIPRLSPQDELALRMSGERGNQIAEAIRGMDTQQRAITARRAQAGGQVAQALQRVPEERRAAMFQSYVPTLIAQGFTQEEINALGASGFGDQVLEGYIRQSDLASRLARAGGEGFTLGEGQVRYGPNGEVIASGPAQRPRYYPVQPGGRLELDPSYQGPTTDAPPPQRRTATNPQTGERIEVEYNPQTGQWQRVTGPVSTQTGTAPDWPVPGGRASVPGNFPQ